MLPPALVALIGLAVAGVVVLLIGVRGNSRRTRSGRAMLRSIPEGLARAKQKKTHVLVLFLDPGAEKPPALLDLVFDESLARSLASFERVRVDSPDSDLDVVNVLAAKYGLPAVEPPALLVLDRDGRRLEALVGPKELGKGPEQWRESFVAFLERARARF